MVTPIQRRTVGAPAFVDGGGDPRPPPADEGGGELPPEMSACNPWLEDDEAGDSTKRLFWVLLTAITVAFCVTIMLQSAHSRMNARLIENRRPNPYFVHVVEPKMRAYEREYACNAAGRAAVTTQPTTRIASPFDRAEVRYDPEW